MLLTAQMPTTAELPSYMNILNQHRMRCRECDEKGKVIVPIKWSEKPG